MHNLNLSDTIAAIATPLGESGIGVIRLSGKDSLRLAQGIFIAQDGKRLADFATHSLHHGWIIDKKTKETLDEVLLVVMRAPHTYTGEDCVEISCHGGIVVLRSVLDLILTQGCRLAEPGEFTRRAFLNGRIDLAQAEAVLDIIRAKTDSALKIGIGQLRGTLSARISNFRKMLLEILAVLEANIDFPDDETGSINTGGINDKLKRVSRQLQDILESARYGRMLREGIHIVICGRPNVGKSSLLNALLKQERSIVTPVAGTTRDTIEEVMDIKGIPIRIVDTAGIIEPRDLVEKKAVQRARKYIDLADLVILLFDGSQRLSEDDKVIMRKIKGKTTLAVINKIDLKQKIPKQAIIKKFGVAVEISAKKIKNINLLEEAISDLVYQGKVKSPESILVSNARHIEAMRKAQKLIAEALNSLDNELPIEFIAQSLRDALGYLDGILGKRFSEDLLDKIFSEFCIGK